MWSCWDQKDPECIAKKCSCRAYCDRVVLHGEFFYDRLRERIRELLKIDLDLAERANIRRGNFTVSVDGRTKSCKVSELHDAVRESCFSCRDFTSRFADISVGSVGSPEGYSTVIIRSERGKKLFDLLDAERKDVRKDEIIRLASMKRKRV